MINKMNFNNVKLQLSNQDPILRKNPNQQKHFLKKNHKF